MKKENEKKYKVDCPSILFYWAKEFAVLGVILLIIKTIFHLTIYNLIGFSIGWLLVSIIEFTVKIHYHKFHFMLEDDSKDINVP